MGKKTFIVISLTLGLLSSGVAAGPGEGIPVAAIFSLTGRGANSNLRHLQGVQLAVEEINARGGVRARPIELAVCDNRSTVVGSTEAAREAVARGVIAIIGSSWSDHSLAIAPIAQQAGVPMVSNYSSNPKVTQVGNYIFRVCYLDTFQARLMAQFARHHLHIQKVATLYQSGNDYSTDLAVFFDKEFRSRGGEVVSQVPYLKDSLDYSEALHQIKGSKAEAIYLPGYEKETGLIMKQAYKMGIHLPILGADGWGDAMPKYLGGVVEDGYEVKAWNPESPQPISRHFVASFRKKFGEGEILSGTALAYDATLLLADAMTRAQAIDRTKIRDALAATQGFVGVTGPIRFDENRNPIKGAIINRYAQSQKSRYFLMVQP